MSSSADPTPTKTQLAAIDYYISVADRQPPRRHHTRVSETTRAVCRRNGWLRRIEEFPFHSPTDAGRRAVAAHPNFALTDEAILDRMATLLGTSTEWSSGADYLEAIADLIGQVRPHPGSMEPDEFAEQFRKQTGRPVVSTWDQRPADRTAGWYARGIPPQTGGQAQSQRPTSDAATHPPQRVPPPGTASRGAVR